MEPGSRLGWFAGVSLSYISLFMTSRFAPQEPLWLVWQYEGDFTLYDLMQEKAMVCLSDHDLPPQEPLWLVWQYEGDFTLYDLMQKKEWPYNLEPLLFGRELDLPRGPRRRWVTLRLVMKQVREGVPRPCCSCGAQESSGSAYSSTFHRCIVWSPLVDGGSVSHQPVRQVYINLNDYAEAHQVIYAADHACSVC